MIYTTIYLIISFFLSTNFNIQNNTESKKILFIGHAYGMPEVYNEMMDPSVSSFFQNYSASDYTYIVWGGDFINDCTSSIEISNFFESLPKGVVEKSLFIWGDHEFDCYENESFKFLKNDENRLVTIDEYDIFLLNSNFKEAKIMKIF